jgi:hypothetical protein
MNLNITYIIITIFFLESFDSPFVTINLWIWEEIIFIFILYCLLLSINISPIFF